MTTLVEEHWIVHHNKVLCLQTYSFSLNWVFFLNAALLERFLALSGVTFGIALISKVQNVILKTIKTKHNHILQSRLIANYRPYWKNAAPWLAVVDVAKIETTYDLDFAEFDMLSNFRPKLLWNRNGFYHFWKRRLRPYIK